jgi:cellulose synthase/poly-beta-1,6-N-acetylglucosamine synthase-like glycosyltransferase
MREFLVAFVLAVNYVALIYMIGVMASYFLQLLFAGGSLGRYLRYLRFADYRRFADSENMVPVSLIVPAYNEEATIVEAVKNLLQLNYQEYEVIVVNDGSKDNTLKLLRESFRLTAVERPYKRSLDTKPVRAIYRTPLYSNLIVVDKENGGKADALNMGINLSRYPVFVSMDADSLLEKQALVRIITPFLNDHTVIGVGGVVRVASGCVIENGDIKEIRLPKTALGKLQTVEYFRSFFTGRIGASSMGTLLIISGPSARSRRTWCLRPAATPQTASARTWSWLSSSTGICAGSISPIKSSFCPIPSAGPSPPSRWGTSSSSAAAGRSGSSTPCCCTGTWPSTRRTARSAF